MRTQLRTFLSLLTMAGLITVSAVAQVQDRILTFDKDHTFEYVASEVSFGGNVIKGAPYSADAVTEMTQTLPDGNRIVRKSTAAVHRDSEGRSRREQTLDAIGPWAASGEPIK